MVASLIQLMNCSTQPRQCCLSMQRALYYNIWIRTCYQSRKLANKAMHRSEIAFRFFDHVSLRCLVFQRSPCWSARSVILNIRLLCPILDSHGEINVHWLLHSERLYLRTWNVWEILYTEWLHIWPKQTTTLADWQTPTSELSTKLGLEIATKERDLVGSDWKMLNLTKKTELRTAAWIQMMKFDVWSFNTSTIGM